SAEQRLADVASVARPRRYREYRAADVLDVLVQRVARAQAPLDRDELALRIALEADEEEAGFELAEALVDAVGEGVAAAQDALAPVGRGRGKADVGVGRDHRSATALGFQVEWVELLAAAKRGARILVAADRLFLIGEGRAVPDLEQHADAPG